VVACVAVALLATGCAGRSTSETETEATVAAPAAATGDFGDLKAVCQKGTAKTATAQGVTADEIQVGTFSDIGFTKNPEFVNTAKVFTSWCNAAGGINGRKLVSNTRDSKLVEVRQQMLTACREDFALVGGGSALDALGVQDRLKCLLPDFPAQTSMPQSAGSDLQLNQTGSTKYDGYAGYHEWLLKEAYPGSAGLLGIITGDSAITKILAVSGKEALEAAGGKVIYNDLYPALGVSDWTPYAQSLKSKNVKGLLFYGDYSNLAKLNQSLTSINYKLDWIDANSNAYNAAFVQLGGLALDSQNNLADIGGVYPLEKAASNPATQQVLDLFNQYARGQQVTYPALRAFSAWLVFAKSAASCGDTLTRKCVYEAARKESAWTGGGLQAAADLSSDDDPPTCFNIEKVSSKGWQPADFKPNQGAYRCSAPVYKYKGSYGKALTLADVGKSLSDLK
jgi:ABC-type branched-subunit amino acid transport system substrate-binding protein